MNNEYEQNAAVDAAVDYLIGRELEIIANQKGILEEKSVRKCNTELVSDFVTILRDGGFENDN